MSQLRLRLLRRVHERTRQLCRGSSISAVPGLSVGFRTLSLGSENCHWVPSPRLWCGSSGVNFLTMRASVRCHHPLPSHMPRSARWRSGSPAPRGSERRPTSLPARCAICICIAPVLQAKELDHSCCYARRPQRPCLLARSLPSGGLVAGGRLTSLPILAGTYCERASSNLVILKRGKPQPADLCQPVDLGQLSSGRRTNIAWRKVFCGSHALLRHMGRQTSQTTCDALPSF